MRPAHKDHCNSLVKEDSFNVRLHFEPKLESDPKGGALCRRYLEILLFLLCLITTKGIKDLKHQEILSSIGALKLLH
ncbi:hypothetical protein L596_019419 [Steinernema carpocapsae]|uniref:Uncharacterized protein n=1 Tax=Steinernema carpocapsae TaxID=34508 RepID=A0A4U5MQH1_STECR|nr:hypothetical protein L596_019419 [Steinernema carpocapsae]